MLIALLHHIRKTNKGGGDEEETKKQQHGERLRVGSHLPQSELTNFFLSLFVQILSVNIFVVRFRIQHKKLVVKAVYDMNGINFDMSSKILMMNKVTSQIYNDIDILIDTDIRNGSEVVFITINDDAFAA